MKNIYKKVSEQLGIAEDTIQEVYKLYWSFIKDTIESLPLKEKLTENEFNKLKTNFNIPLLGKLSCDYNRFKGVKESLKIKSRNYENFRNKTTSKPCCNNC